MLLSIDATKVEEQLGRSRPSYTVTACNLEVAAGDSDQPSTTVVSTVVAMPPELELARERLIRLRQNLIQRGQPLLSAEDLDRELDETRGRS